MKYLTFFSTEAEGDLQLATSPAGVNKGRYIAQLLQETGHSVEIVSPAWSKCGRWRYWKAFDQPLDERITLHQLATFGTPLRWLTPLQWVHSLLQLFFYLLLHTQAGEPVVVYHSYYASLPVLLAKRLKKFKLVLEVEEIYQDVLSLPGPLRRWETNILHGADGYILSTEELREEVNRAGKPDLVINGSYMAESPREVPPFDDGKVHCIYAGTLDPAKGGAAAAVAAAAFLPQNYHIHVLGFGSDTQKAALLEQIHHVQAVSQCGLTYEGLLQGEAYIRFLQRCQIGLSTQVPEGNYIKSSFPSKILTYLANGLQVVSARLPSVEHSGVGDMITYYDAQTPEAIAAAIQAVDLAAACAPARRLQELHEQARTHLQTMLEDF